MTTPEWAAADEDDSDRYPERYSGDSKVPATFHGAARPATETAEQTPAGATDAHALEFRQERYEDAIRDAEDPNADHWVTFVARNVMRVADEEQAGLRAEIERQDAHYRDWQKALQEEYRKAAETWDRQRERLTRTQREARDRAEAAEAGVRAAVFAWADDAPEGTAGLDLLRQIVTPAPVSSGEAGTGEMLCDEPTLTTDHGTYLDWSVPRFCNKPKGHGGSHVYTRIRPAPVVAPSAEGGES